MKKLGVGWILSVSAVGSLKAEYKPTDIVVIDQFFDRTKRNKELTFFGEGLVAHVAFADPICPNLHRLLVESSQRAGAGRARTRDLCEHGRTRPSPRAPNRSFIARWAGMWIGMTTYGEARCAREAEICFASLAMVTDYDCWLETEEPVTAEMVLGNLQKNAAMAQEIVRLAVKSRQVPSDCPCHHALANAILTDPKVIRPATRRKTAVAGRRYLKAPKRG